MQYFPRDKQTDEETDKIIEALGPESVERALKYCVDTGVVEPKQIFLPPNLKKKPLADLSEK